MIVLHDAAVGADGHIDAGFLEVLIPLRRHVNHRRGLPPADALGFPGDADGTAANADFHEVGAGVRQKAESLAVHHVAGAHLHRVAVAGTNPLQTVLLPVGIALGGVHHQHVRAGLHQSGHPLLIVPGVDAGAYHIALPAVQQFQRVALVGIVVLAEHETHQTAVSRHDGQGVELMIPDNVVGLLQAGALRGGNHLFRRGHEFRHTGGGIHAADPVVPAGNQPQQLSGAGAILRDGHGGVPRLLFQSQHIRQRIRYPQVGVADHKAGLVILHLPHHGGLRFNGLGHIDEGNAPLPGQSDAHLLAGNRLHHGGHHRHVHGQGALLPLFEPHHRGLQGHVGRDALLRGVARHQQVLAEGMGRLLKKIRHSFYLFLITKM